MKTVTSSLLAQFHTPPQKKEKKRNKDGYMLKSLNKYKIKWRGSPFNVNRKEFIYNLAF